jgi:hypothetical protein
MGEEEQAPGQADRVAPPTILVVATDPKLLNLFLGVAVPSKMESQGYPTRFLGLSWKVEALYTAVRELLGHLP